MQISTSTSASSLAMLQRLFAARDDTESSAATPAADRQKMQGCGRPPAMSMMGGAQMAPASISAAVSLQMMPPDTSELASDLVSSLDQDGDGQVSAAEIEAAFADANITVDVSEAFAKLDANLDNLISSAEMADGLEAMFDADKPHRMGPPPPRPDAIAGDLISAFDADEDNALSLEEIASGLGIEANDELTSAVSALDENGDGVLSSEELSAGIRAAFSEGLKAYSASAALSS